MGSQPPERRSRAKTGEAESGGRMLAFDCSITNRAFSCTTIAGPLRTQADAEGRMSIFLTSQVLHSQSRGPEQSSLDQGGVDRAEQNRIASECIYVYVPTPSSPSRPFL
jgi:hypothetical protein